MAVLAREGLSGPKNTLSMPIPTALVLPIPAPHPTLHLPSLLHYWFAECTTDVGSAPQLQCVCCGAGVISSHHQAECPTIQLSSVTTYPETASDSIG